MPKPADIGSKRLISLAPDLWVQWVTPIREAIKIVNTLDELRQIYTTS